jgi:adenylate cyclase class IV
MDEIEIRGKINKKEFEKLSIFLSKNAELVDEYDRLSVDISPGFDPKTRNWDQINKKANNNQIDLRIKKSGKNEKISVKLGHYASKSRQEFEIDLKEGELVDSLRLFEALGFKTGMIYFWKSSLYKYKDFEIKINEYPSGYRDWEIESQNSQSDPNDLARELSLKSFTEKEFKDEINWKNNNLHDLYSLGKVKELLKSLPGE